MGSGNKLTVVGAGSGGIGAALAAARLGAKVTLVDRFGMLGGTSTVGGVNCWEPGVGGTGLPFEIFLRLRKIPGAAGVYSCGRHFCHQKDGFFWPNELSRCIYPGGESIIDAARAYADTLRRHYGQGGGASLEWRQEHWHGVPFEPAQFDRVVREMLLATGNVELKLGLEIASVKVSAGEVLSLCLSDGSVIEADAFIDSTGDAALCRLAGCEQHSGLDPQARYGEASAPQAAKPAINGATLIYRVSPCGKAEVEALPAGIPPKAWWRNDPVSACVNHYPNGDLNINMLPTMDGAEALALGWRKAHEECSRRVRQHWHFIQSNFPEFRQYRLGWIAPFLGIRESFRTICEKMLTENDIRLGLSGQPDRDIIAIADHPFDRHGEGGGAVEVEQPYGIPYRCLVPKGFHNLLVACRGAGFSSLAATSCRLSRTMMQLGQAAGTAAAICLDKGLPLPEAPAADLRASLQAQHVQLAWPLEGGIAEYITGCE